MVTFCRRYLSNNARDIEPHTLFTKARFAMVVYYMGRGAPESVLHLSGAEVRFPNHRRVLDVQRVGYLGLDHGRAVHGLRAAWT
jgi:hypothetical protein